MTKAEIRKIYLQKRMALSPEQVAELNKKITENFFSNIDLASVKILHSFLPIEKQREVNTWFIIDLIKEKQRGIQISIPRVNNQASVIENFFYEGKDQLENNVWGIPEPKSGVPTPTEKIDIVLVPLLAFDLKGNRVGYGRGFYDKFLATLNPSTRKIGLSFFPPEESISAMASYDISIDLAVTPAGVFSFK